MNSPADANQSRIAKLLVCQLTRRIGESSGGKIVQIQGRVEIDLPQVEASCLRGRDAGAFLSCTKVSG